jgi:CRP-like cAMP-binding protein
MKPRNKKHQTVAPDKGKFDAQAFLDSAGVARRVREFKKTEIVYSQGDAATGVIYLREGNVRKAASQARPFVWGPPGLFH